MWRAIYQNGSEFNGKYDDIDRDKIYMFEVILEDGVKLFSTKNKSFIYRKRQHMNAQGIIYKSNIIYGDKDGLYELDEGSVKHINIKDIELTKNELPYYI